MRNSDTKQCLVSLQTPLLSHYSTHVCVCLGESREISQRGLCSHRLSTSTWKASGEGRSITFVCRPWKKSLGAAESQVIGGKLFPRSQSEEEMGNVHHRPPFLRAFPSHGFYLCVGITQDSLELA